MRSVHLATFLLIVAALPAARAGDDPKPPAAPEKSAPADIVKGIAWQSDFDTARALAKKEGKGVLVYLTPSWFH